MLLRIAVRIMLLMAASMLLIAWLCRMALKGASHVVEWFPARRPLFYGLVVALSMNSAVIAATGDSDNDGQPDLQDNCIKVANGPLLPDRGGHVQRDTDRDGYGNFCDGDFDNDGTVDAEDVQLLQSRLGSRSAPNQDLNGNGTVDSSDLTRIQAALGKPPGPSGPKDVRVSWQVFGGKRFAVDDESVPLELKSVTLLGQNLQPTSIQWRSSLQGALGAQPALGTPLQVTLKEGEHKLTMTADFGPSGTLRRSKNRPILPRRTEPTTFQATPADGYRKLMPVVLINFIPTLDGRHINDKLWEGRPWGLPSEWGGTKLITDVRQYISDITSRAKFMLEEGSRFRGYKNAGAPPYLGYQVVAIYNFYEEMRPGQRYPGSQTGFLPDLHDIMGRIPAQKFVEEQGAREFWVNVYEMWGEGEIVFPESNMSSPTTGDVSNSHRIPDDLPVFSKTYVVYGTNYFRTQAEAVHNHGHQIEAMLSHAAWLQDGHSKLFWEKFVGFDISDPAKWVWKTGHCGATHFPLNARGDYDYYNDQDIVESDCENWRPDGLGQRRQVGLSTWADIPYDWPTSTVPQKDESQWYVYWMQNMPGYGNTIPYGNTTMENWWTFTADWDQAIAAGKGLHRLGE